MQDPAETAPTDGESNVRPVPEAQALRRSWLGEARRRGVVRVATSYAVIAWLLLQIGDVTFQPLGVPPWVFPALIITAFLGFPVALALAWFLELTPQGVEIDTAPASVPRPHVHGLRRYADVVIIAVLLIVVGALLTRDRITPRDQAPASGTLSARTVAVLPFKDLTTVAQGGVLAPGIAEAVLHQLASLHDINVIARTSSFVFEGNEDVRAIGQKLNARYLLEGSVQSDGKRLRVTAQLIDAGTGGDVWSLRFDRTLEDVFAMQDEIALQVARALKISLDPDAKEKLTGQGTTNIDAYLEYMEARNLLAVFSVADMPSAVTHLNNALRADPQFADAYALLASAEVHRAEYEVSDDREARLVEAVDRADTLIARALELDPGNAEAFIQRAYLRTFTDTASAEADYRHGIELNPNSAPACEGLASVVFQDPLRRDEALELIERARRLDPLEPRIDVLKAVFLSFGRGSMLEAAQMLEGVLDRNADYLPALTRLSGTRMTMGQYAESVRLATRVLTLDPRSEDSRGVLVRSYLDMGKPESAERVLAEAPAPVASRAIPLLVYRGDWSKAAEAAYAGLEAGTVSQVDIKFAVMAIRVQARATADYARGIDALENDADIEWDAQGHPALKTQLELPESEVGLADLLLLSGDVNRGRNLTHAILARLDFAANEARVGRVWDWDRPIAMALLGDGDGALSELERRAAAGFNDEPWFYYSIEPAFEALRGDPRFQRLVEDGAAHAASERATLEHMRATGELTQ